MAHAAADGGRAGAAAVGAPLRVWAHISLADLMRLPGSAELVAQWAAQLHARWAGQRAAAAEEGGHQGL